MNSCRDPLTVRSVPHMRAFAFRVREALDGPFAMPAAALCLGVQVAEMLGDDPLRRRCQLEALTRLGHDQRDGDVLLLKLCVHADDPDALLPHIDSEGHAGFYAAIRCGYAAVQQKRADILEAVVSRLATQSGVYLKLMSPEWERNLMAGALKWVRSGRVPMDELMSQARTLSGHHCQGAQLDIAFMFNGARFA